MTTTVFLQSWYTDPWSWVAVLMAGAFGATLGAAVAFSLRRRALPLVFAGALPPALAACALLARLHPGWQYAGESPSPVAIALDRAGPWAVLPLACAGFVLLALRRPARL